MAITKVTNSLVATNAIQGTLIADNAITSVHIAQNQVTSVQIPDSSITSTQLAANSVDTAELISGSIDAIHLASDSVTTAKILDANVTTAKIANNAITSALIPDGSITDTQLGSGAFTMGNITTTGAIRGPASLTIDPATVGDNTGTVVIAGNLQVDGTTTTVNSTTLDVVDKNITLGKGGSASANNGGGITIDGADATILYTHSGTKWSFNKPLEINMSAGSTYSGSFTNTSAQSWGVFIKGGADNDDYSLRVQDKDAADLLSVKSGGNVGIGTSAPQGHLDINTESAEATTVIINGEINQDKILKFRHYSNSEAAGDGYAGFIGSVVDNVLTLGHYNSSNTEVQALHIDEAGNVGIGITAPIAPLTINDNLASASNNTDIFVKNPGTAYTNGDPHIYNAAPDGILVTANSARTDGPDKMGLVLYNDNNTAGGFSPMLLFAKRETGSTPFRATMAGIYAKAPTGTGNSGAWIDGQLHFATAGAATEGIKSRMVIDKEGNVGIGTTSPTTKLDILDANSVGLRFGDIASTPSSQTACYIGMSTSAYSGNNGDLVLIPRTSSTSRILLMEGNVGIGTTNPTDKLHVGANSGGTQLKIQSAASNNNCILHTNGTTDSWRTGMNLALTNGSYEFYDDVNNVSRMVLDSSGKVGIGTTTPGSNHTKANNLVVGSGSAGGMAVFNGTAEGWYAFSRANANNTDAYDGGMSYTDRVLRFHTNAGTERLKIEGDGLATFTSTRNEWAMRLKSGSNRGGIVLDKPGTTTIMGSMLMLAADETFRLGTASNYHVRMDQSGNTYMGNTSTTRFTQNGNLSVNTTTANSGITSGTDVRALGPCFANDANSFTMSQEGTGNTDAYLAARGPNGSTNGNIRIGVSVSGGGGFKTGVRIDNLGRTTTPENPAFRYRATAAQVLNSGWQQVGYGTLKEERGTGYSSTNSRFTAPVAGWYQFNAAWTATNNADTDGTLAIWINGSSSDLVSSTSMPNTGGSYDGHFCGGCCYLDVDDYVQVHRYSTVSTTTRSSAPYGGWFSGFLIG